MTRDNSVDIMANASPSAKSGDWIWKANPELQQGLSEWEMQEIVLRANKKFQEVAKENAASTGDGVIETVVLDKHLGKIVDEVKKDSDKVVSVFDVSSNSVVYGHMDTSISNGHGNIRLSTDEKDSLMKKFQNYGTTMSYPFGRRHKVNNIARDAGFLFEKKDSFKITRNEQDKNLVEMTFNGNCQESAYYSIGNNCFVGVAYNSTTGNVTIMPDKVFHAVKNEENKDVLKPIDLKKTGGWFGKSDLEKEFGSRKIAKEVTKSFKSLKLIGCSNPPRIEGVKEELQPKRSADVMVNGKTRGKSLSTAGKIKAAALLCLLAVPIVLTGVGITVGAGMLLGAGALAVSAITSTGAGAAGVSSVSSVASSSGAAIKGIGVQAGKTAAMSPHFVAREATDFSAQGIAATSAVGTAVLGTTAMMAKSTAAGLASSAASGAASVAKMAAVEAGNGILLGGEKAASSMVKVLGNGAFAVESFVANSSAASGLNSAGNGLESAVNVVGNGVRDSALVTGNGAGPTAETVGNGIQNAAVTAGNGVESGANGLAEGLSNMDNATAGGIENAAVNSGEGVQTAGNVVADGTVNVTNTIGDAVSDLPQPTIGSATVGTTRANLPVPTLQS